jgi:hypothetical protein
MHQARHRALPFDITIESRSRHGARLVRVQGADGRLRVDEVPDGDDGRLSSLVQADGQWLVIREDGTGSAGHGTPPPQVQGGPWMPMVDLVIDPSPLLPQLEFEVLGDRTIEGRRALLLGTSLRADEPFGLMGLPGWYDLPVDAAQPEYRERAGRYEIAIDALRGILLSVVPLAPESDTERLTVTARFDTDFDADTFSRVPPAGVRITKVKPLWTVRTVAEMAWTLLMGRKRLFARAERERQERLASR